MKAIPKWFERYFFRIINGTLPFDSWECRVAMAAAWKAYNRGWKDSKK